MAREKAIKVDYKDVKAKYENGELVGTVEIIEEETAEVTNIDVNVTSEVKTLLDSLKEDETISINIKKFKPVATKEKQPIFKYMCSCEDPREIKSKCEYLNVHCNDCDEDFQIIEK